MPRKHDRGRFIYQAAKVCSQMAFKRKWRWKWGTSNFQKLGSISVPIKTDLFWFSDKAKCCLTLQKSPIHRWKIQLQGLPQPRLTLEKCGWFIWIRSRDKPRAGISPWTIHEQNGRFLCTKTWEFDHCKFGTWTSNLLKWGPTWSNTPQTDESWMHKPNFFFNAQKEYIHITLDSARKRIQEHARISGNAECLETGQKQTFSTFSWSNNGRPASKGNFPPQLNHMSER